MRLSVRIHREHLGGVTLDLTVIVMMNVTFCLYIILKDNMRGTHGEALDQTDYGRRVCAPIYSKLLF